MRLRMTSFSAVAQWPGSLSWFNGDRYFHLELGSRYRWYLGPVRTTLVVLCLVVSLWIIWTVMHAASVISNRQDLETRLRSIQEEDRQLIDRAQQEGIDLSPPALQQLPIEVGLANQLLVKRNFSWTQFLSGLEEAIPEHVSIRSVRLDPGSATIHLTGAAVTVEDVTTLTLKLQNHPVFRDPVLGQHHSAGDGLVEFDLSLKYHPQEHRTS